MCSGCGRCGKVETGHHAVVTSVAPSVDLVQVASQEAGTRRTPSLRLHGSSRSGEPPGSVSSPMI